MTTLSIRGHVTEAATRRPLAKLRVEAWGAIPRADKRLGHAITDAKGAFAIKLDARLAKEIQARRPEVYFKVFLGKQLIANTRSQVSWSSTDPDARVTIPIGGGGPTDGNGGAEPSPLQVSGVVTTDAGVAVSGVHVEARDQRLGDTALLVAGITDARGAYTLHYDSRELRDKPRPDLFVRVLDPRNRNAEIARSPVLYQADSQVTVNLSIKAGRAKRASEYARLLDAAQPVLGKTALGDLDAKGVEYVANRVRWDARTVAMATQAAALSKATRIPAEHYYALMRSGIPGDASSMHRLPVSSVDRALRLAIAGGVIGDDHPIDATLAIYREKSAAALKQFTPAVAISSLGDMLALSLNAAKTETFLEAYHETADRPGELWSVLAKRGLDKETVARLQTDGKLGFLTRQNAPLIARLRKNAHITTAEDLPRAGLYKAEAWKKLISNDAPNQIGVDAYAAGLAAQVNLGYPTLVAAEMVRRGEIPVDAEHEGEEGEVAKFLREGHARHTIGVDPVKRWKGFDKLSPKGRDGARLVERLFQLSPSNESMETLHRLGFQSALDIVREPRELFLAKHGDAFPSRIEGEWVYQKAQEIHTTVLNLSTMYLTYQSAPNVYAMTGSPGTAMINAAMGGAPNMAMINVPNDVSGVPTLEGLLRNMDYCACDECKSVLGPAAYFVELLQFIDVADVPAGKTNPQEVLFERRPDLQDMLLSCENTNVAFPYIDLVNEILEHFVINGDLAAFHGHNMRENSKTADLLADPEYVENAAYDKTKSEVYPHDLPFDMPLAALRLLMQAWNTTLSDALAVFGTPAASRRETLGLNGGEHQILTDTTYKALPEYFGEPAAATLDELNAAIADGKTFCRRTAIEAEDLVALLRTRFINPGAPLVPLLQPLAITLQQLQSWYTGGLDDDGLLALLPATLDPAAYGGDVLQWLRDHRDLIMGLITLTDVSADAQECSFATVELRFALPDNAANRLSALAYQKLHRFIRLWKKLGWSIELTDQVVITFLGVAPQALTDGNLDATLTALVARIANFVSLQRRQSIPGKKLGDWLAVWDKTTAQDIRRDTLAHLLRIGTTDLANFSEITGIDPLADDMASDAPSLLRFLDAWHALKTARLKVVDLDYLLRHRDGDGALTPTVAALLRDLKALRDGLTAIDVDLGTPPENADLGYARAKMALVYDGAVVDRFFGLISGGTTYDAPLATVEETLPAKLGAVDARLAFDPFGKALTYTGILSAAKANALRTAADTLVLADVSVIQNQADLDAFVAAFKVAVQGLSDAGQAEIDGLDADYHELKLVYDAIAAIADPAAQAKALIDQILPALRGRLKETSLRTTLAARLKTDPLLIEVLTEGPAIVQAVGNAAVGVLQDFLRLEDAVAFDANLAYALYLDPPSTDDYILYVGAPAGTSVTLAIDGVVVIPATVLGARGEVETGAALQLRSGALSSTILTLAALPGGGKAELRWRTKGMAKASVPASRLYAKARVDDARASLLRLQKAALLLRAMPLTPRELHHLAGVNVDTAGYLNALDVDGTIMAAALHAQWARLAWLAWFSQLKTDEPDADTWVGLLEQPGRLTPAGTLVLAAAAGWTDQDLTDVLAHFALGLAGLSALHAFRKAKEAVDFVVATNQTAADMIAWTVESPDALLIAQIKDSLRSHQDDLSWRTTLQSVNDPLRNQRRDALVSYILHHQAPAPDIDAADKLYEYFLIDVEMDACMLTSRIRQALSTVQLFVMRCLMNLEPEVAASSIRADRWAWMKRYRVWEANRKIFLYPENWLEPELRDNKSPFFRDLESELLKADITDELAEDAYLSYLKKLDEVARLEILGCYLQQGAPGDPDDDILHVFGRTNGSTRQYYYRRYEFGYWTPWAKVNLHIEGDLLFPVIWKSQLFVFWLSMVHKPSGADSDQNPKDMGDHPWGSSARVTAEINLAWGEYYQGNWTSPKSSELNDPIVFSGMTEFEPEKVVVAVRTEKPSPDISERLIVSVLYLGSPINASRAVFTSKNAPPIISSGSDDDLLNGIDLFNYWLLWYPRPSAVLAFNALKEPGKVFAVTITQPDGAAKPTLDETVLTKTGAMSDGFRVRPLMHPVENQWEAPLFYSDERSVLFLSPDERVQTVPHYSGYFWNDVAAYALPPDEMKIAPIYEQPVIKDPIGPVVNQLQNLVNPNYERVINDNHAFVFGGVSFDARGVVNQEAGR
jgi:hypothetical protein